MRKEQGYVEFPEGHRLVDGYWERLDILRGVEFIIPHPELSKEIWVPDAMEGYRFRQVNDTWHAEQK